MLPAVAEKVHSDLIYMAQHEALQRARAQWADLVAQLTEQYPDAAARVFVDILNEPDSFQLQWQAQDDAGLPGAGDLYLAAMDAIYPVNSGARCWKCCATSKDKSQDNVLLSGFC